MLRNALDGLTVIDFTQIAAGPTSTMLLADMGARVIKVETRDGDLGRKLGPAWIGEDSALFHAFNRNKHSISLNLKEKDGLAIARKLIANADIVVESMRPGAMDRLGLGYEQISREIPSLIYCSISAYGQTGPYAERAGVDGILQADSGLMSLIGVEDGEPCKVQAPVVDVMTGYIALAGILAKIIQRNKDGKGGHLDVNMLNSSLALQQSSLGSYLADEVLPKKLGSAAPYSAPNQAFQTSDGWVMAAAYIGDRWRKLCETLGRPELIDDPLFATSQLRLVNRDLMVKELTREFVKRSTAHWLHVLGSVDILCAPVSSYAEVVKHPQVEANAMLSKAIHPTHGVVRTPGFPISSIENNAVPMRPAPACGQHSYEILREIGYSDAKIVSLTQRGVVYFANALNAA